MATLPVAVCDGEGAATSPIPARYVCFSLAAIVGENEGRLETEGHELPLFEYTDGNMVKHASTVCDPRLTDQNHNGFLDPQEVLQFIQDVLPQLGPQKPALQPEAIMQKTA